MKYSFYNKILDFDRVLLWMIEIYIFRDDTLTDESLDVNIYMIINMKFLDNFIYYGRQII